MRERVFIRSTTENGLDFPRLHNDACQGRLVRAVQVLDEYTHWKLVRIASNNNFNFMIVSQANQQHLLVTVLNGMPKIVSRNLAVAYDLFGKGADGVCAEFTIRYVSAQNAYTVAIPEGYPAAGTELGLSGHKLSWGADTVLFKAGLPSLWRTLLGSDGT